MNVMNRYTLVALLAASCASGPAIRDRRADGDPSEAAPAKEVSPAPAPQADKPKDYAPQQEKPFDPKEFAAGFNQPTACEQEARAMGDAKGRDLGWAILRECVNRGLTNLKRVADSYWLDDLQKRKDASVLLTKVLANRGGDIEGDLALLHQKRISLFSLAMAMEQPKTYLGRLVVLRVRVDETKEGGPFNILVAETSVNSVTRTVQGPASSTYTTSYSGQSSRYGSASREVTYSSQSYRTRNENAVMETGRGVLLKLPKSDPFFGPGKEFIILGRFEGVKKSGEVEGSEEEATLGLVSVISYFEPAALVIE